MSYKKRLLWQIYIPFLVIIILSLFLISWKASRSLKSLYYDNQVDDLRIRALIIHQIVDDHLNTPGETDMQKICVGLSQKIQTRITVIHADGVVIADSEKDPALMNNHADRPEIRNALNGNIGSSQRFSYTLNISMLYVAIPVEKEGKVAAVIRVSKPMTYLSATLHTIYNQLISASIFISILAALIALMLSNRIRKPISEMIAGLKRFSQGDLKHRLYITQSGEMRQLADAMNQMAVHLDDRINTVTRQRNEIQTMLSSMVEAMIAVNTQEQIIRFNHAASTLFHITPEDAKGKNVSEVIRNTELVVFVKRALTAREPQEAHIVMWNDQRTVQARGTRLQDSDGQNVGALIILNDITQIKKMERVRSDFVANVSHELKTPITSIKGFVETLKDGAIHDPENADRFLEIVSKHTDRLNAIIEDLLKLSRLEDEGISIEFEEIEIIKIIKDAIIVCRKKAEQKQIEIEIKCETDLTVSVNPPLLEEALINLIDNALKYSPEENKIEIKCSQDQKGTEISIEDNGPGIAQKHLPRIFERFYRVDRARSREIGGTGLGLSIVKHIVQAHQGEVSVDSVVGTGSTFRIHLPRHLSC
ncbi:PAS domain S-box protein [candidate division KSB1 bacterium]|nr:PAS domain S-box protein [candidate division KSB1 bacterium]